MASSSGIPQFLTADTLSSIRAILLGVALKEARSGFVREAACGSKESCGTRGLTCCQVVQSPEDRTIHVAHYLPEAGPIHHLRR